MKCEAKAIYEQAAARKGKPVFSPSISLPSPESIPSKVEGLGTGTTGRPGGVAEAEEEKVF